MLITLQLIVTNVFNSVKAPTKRGFSFVEIWMVGVQIPILIGIFEYGIILAMKKSQLEKETFTIKIGNGANVLSKTMIADKDVGWINFDKLVDKWTFILSLIFILTFNASCRIHTKIKRSHLFSVAFLV